MARRFVRVLVASLKSTPSETCLVTSDQLTNRNEPIVRLLLAATFGRRRLRDAQRSRLAESIMRKRKISVPPPLTKLFALLACSWAVSIVMLLTQCTAG